MGSWGNFKVATIPEIRSKAQHIMKHKNTHFLCLGKMQPRASNENQLRMSDFVLAYHIGI